MTRPSRKSTSPKIALPGGCPRCGGAAGHRHTPGCGLAGGGTGERTRLAEEVLGVRLDDWQVRILEQLRYADELAVFPGGRRA